MQIWCLFPGRRRVGSLAIVGMYLPCSSPGAVSSQPVLEEAPSFLPKEALYHRYESGSLKEFVGEKQQVAHSRHTVRFACPTRRRHGLHRGDRKKPTSV